MKRLLLLLPFALIACATPAAQAPAGADPAPASATTVAPHPGPCEVITTCAGADGCQGTQHEVGRSVYTWSPEGKLLKLEEDFGQDGVIDVLEESTWSADGLQVTRQRTFLTDRSPEGYKPAERVIRHLIVERFDAQGHLVRVEKDWDADGQAEYAVTKRYDDQGRMIEEEMDGGADGLDVHHVKHNLDANGEYELWASHDFPDSDEACFTHPKVTRDAQRRIVREEFYDSLCDADEVRAHTYDDAGNLTQTTVDLGKDGSVEATMTFSYGCFK